MPDEPPRLSPTVRLLGLVSLFTDISSEMVYPINPWFIVGVLQAPAWTVGLIEGIAESTASLLKLYAGRLSDRCAARKPFALAGYALAALAKPLVALATTWPHVLGARFIDRFGKGIRTAPRDALIAETTDPAIRGRAFGFHRSLDTVGAVTGPLLGWLYLRAHPGAFRTLYWLALIPAAFGVVILAAFVRERRADPTPNHQASAPNQQPFTWGSLSPTYRRYLLIVTLFSLGNSSDAFLILRAQGMGVRPAQLLLLYALFNVVEASLGYFAGSLSDRVGRRPLVTAGYSVFGLVYLGFGLLHGAEAAWTLFMCYGIYYTLTQGVQRAFAADLAHADRRGAELGAFHMLVGLAALPASLAAGWLYTLYPPTPFLLGAGCALAAAIALTASKPAAQGP